MELNIKLSTNIAKTTNFGNKRNLQNIKYIVVHYTANNGDTAIGNGKYFANNNTGASAHYFVDENEAVQSVYDNYVAYHCGATKYYHSECRNNNSIGVELCSRKNGNNYYFKDETVKNAVEIVKWLMDKYNIPVDNVIRHYDVTHKNCPAPFVENISLWNNFKNMLVEEADEVIETGTITVNGKNMKIDKIIKDGVTFIKLRGLEGAGFDIGYDANTKNLTLNNTVKDLDVNADGSIKQIKAVNINGSNYIPIREIEKLVDNADVDYVNGEVTVSVK